MGPAGLKKDALKQQSAKEPVACYARWLGYPDVAHGGARSSALANEIQGQTALDVH